MTGKHDPFYDHLGAHMTEIRKRRGMRQADVAAKMGIVPTTITHYELGDNRTPLSVFLRWCKVLEVHPATVIADLTTPVNDPVRQ